MTKTRVLKNETEHQLLRLSDDMESGGEIVLVRGGRKAYLHVNAAEYFGGIDFHRQATFSGARALRRLAKAILAEVGDE